MTPHTRLPLRIAYISLACIAVSASGQEVPAPGKLLLREAEAAPGDVATRETGDSMEVRVSGKPRGIEGVDPLILQITRRTRDRFRETVLGVDKDGPTLVRRDYEVSRRFEAPAPNEEPKTVVNVRQGKTVTLRRQGERITVSTQQGKLPPDEVQTLQSEFKPESEMRTFPDHPVGVGDEWTIDNSPAGRGGLKSMVLKCRFTELAPFQGRECARIAAELSMSGTANGLPTATKMRGDLYFALDLQRILSLKLSGPMEIKGVLENGGLTFDLDGGGVAEFNWAQTAIEIAGKPAPAPRKRAGAPN